MTYRTCAEIEAELDHIAASPRQDGTLEMIVIRPATNKRRILDRCHLSLERGVEGDDWALGCWKKLPDGRPHPDVQVALTNQRMLQFLADTDEARALAGDNLYVEFDLGEDNLQAGDQLAIGGAILEITEVAHNGCRKFKERFGEDALTMVNSPRGKHLHLRGIYARVVQDGEVRKGDRIRKL